MGIEKSSFLVCYDYGAGGLWGVVFARSEEEIRARYPELTIADAPPSWMVGDHLDRVMSRHYDIDEEPAGLLQVLVRDRLQ